MSKKQNLKKSYADKFEKIWLYDSLVKHRNFIKKQDRLLIRCQEVLEDEFDESDEFISRLIFDIKRNLEREVL